MCCNDSSLQNLQLSSRRQLCLFVLYRMLPFGPRRGNGNYNPPESSKAFLGKSHLWRAGREWDTGMARKSPEEKQGAGWEHQGARQCRSQSDKDKFPRVPEGTVWNNLQSRMLLTVPGMKTSLCREAPRAAGTRVLFTAICVSNLVGFEFSLLNPKSGVNSFSCSELLVTLGRVSGIGQRKIGLIPLRTEVVWNVH